MALCLFFMLRLSEWRRCVVIPCRAKNQWTLDENTAESFPKWSRHISHGRVFLQTATAPSNILTLNFIQHARNANGNESGLGGLGKNQLEPHQRRGSRRVEECLPVLSRLHVSGLVGRAHKKVPEVRSWAGLGHQSSVGIVSSWASVCTDENHHLRFSRYAPFPGVCRPVWPGNSWGSTGTGNSPRINHKYKNNYILMRCWSEFNLNSGLFQSRPQSRLPSPRWRSSFTSECCLQQERSAFW